ncbi:hypothetical protein SCP_1000780 [Sparassis crispa]|uniref:Uncharacterized protein n=1 Tax=Sparassis crispa TaxID=139825 RepID=A0A401GX75_9APHY|nr:hypothetical protein SCP_1000780 [Sparassis crispa]GBE86836.1 hypothetical protein SCP_1000780 [Sparassis crispa]
MTQAMTPDNPRNLRLAEVHGPDSFCNFLVRTRLNPPHFGQFGADEDESSNLLWLRAFGADFLHVFGSFSLQDPLPSAEYFVACFACAHLFSLTSSRAPLVGGPGRIKPWPWLA